MKIIDGKNMPMGRLASFAAKEALLGEEVIILNCDEVIITGNKKNIEEDFEAKRNRVGRRQKGPKVSRLSEMIVKRAIRGMLPNFRTGRGKEAFNRIKCYIGVPEDYKDSKKIQGKPKTGKFIKVKVLSDRK